MMTPEDPECTDELSKSPPATPARQIFSSSSFRGSDCSIRTQSHGPSGLKARIALLEKLIAGQADQISNYAVEFGSLRSMKDQTEQYYQTHVSDMKKTVISDIHRLREEFSQFQSDCKTENAKLTSQVNSLRAEKATLQHQVVALQRRLFDIDDEIGRE